MRLCPVVVATTFTIAGCGGSAPAPAQVASDHTGPPVLPAVPSAELQAEMDAPDRTPKDRELDAGRHPAQLMAFAGIGPGMRVAELGAGLGYTTEILARAVGPTGTVLARTPSGCSTASRR